MDGNLWLQTTIAQLQKQISLHEKALLVHREAHQATTRHIQHLTQALLILERRLNTIATHNHDHTYH